MKLVCVGEEETVVGLHVIGIGAGGWVAAVLYSLPVKYTPYTYGVSHRVGRV